MWIGIGNSIFRFGEGVNWSAYWATRTPSDLVLTVVSDTRIDGAFTINGTGQDGHKVYISTDNVTFTLLDTLTGTDNTFSKTGLTAGTHYWFKVSAYKGTNESSYCVERDDVTFPTILLDSNTVLFSNPVESNITKDSSNRVGQVTSIIGVNNLVQGTQASKPLWNMVETLRFDGTDDFIQTALITFAQPAYLYFVGKQQSWTLNDRVVDGGPGGNAIALNQGFVNPGMYLNAGTPWPDIIYNNNMELHRNFVVRVLYSGVNSKIKINALAAVTANAGTNAPNGITLGATRQGTGVWWNGEIKGFIARKSSDSDANSDIIYNYLLEKYFTGRNVNMVWEGHSMINLVEVDGDIPVTDYTESKLYENYNLKLRHSCNVAVGGATIANIVTRYATSVAANKNTTTGVKNYLVIWIGCNEIHGGMSGSDAYDALHTYVDQTITDGWIPIIITMTKYAADSTTERDAYNNLIKANTDWQYIVDVDQIPELIDNTNETYFNADHIHLISAGSERLANTLYQKIYQAIEDNN